ncbi:MAG: C40 family peptidase [Burkholderiales bacterium]|uniref:C40 family peptidase n=1 Tax=Limnohabitans sp. TaxID=1907725 RepID=UPI0025EC0FCE|nr:C40 family peptidase [Limnohabitans sp.]
MIPRHAAHPGSASAQPQPHRRAMLMALGVGLTGLLTACAAPPVARPVSPLNRPVGPYNTVRNDLALFALSLLDTPYRWGGRGPATGFDCSGLVAHVYREGGGISVQGTAAELGRKSRPITRSALLPGDLVFFNTLGARHSHVGVYVGDGRFVHASNPRTGVRVDHLNHRYYAQRFEGAHTLLD